MTRLESPDASREFTIETPPQLAYRFNSAFLIQALSAASALACTSSLCTRGSSESGMRTTRVGSP